MLHRLARVSVLLLLRPSVFRLPGFVLPLRSAPLWLAVRSMATRTTRRSAASAAPAAAPAAGNDVIRMTDDPASAADGNKDALAPAPKRARGRPKKSEAATPAAPVAAAPAASAAAAAGGAAAGDGPAVAPPSSLGYPFSAVGSSLLLSLRTALSRAGDPSFAVGMQSYMKSAIPCYGCKAAVSRQVFAEVMKDVTFVDGASWASAVATIWDGATHREERYAALYLARSAPGASPWRMDSAVALPLIRALVQSGAWWDYVDDLSSHHLCELFIAHPDVVRPELERWSQGDVLWLRRSAICAQLSCKGAQLDWPLLQRLILPAMSSETFWLRKAIGWALRQVARERPADVKSFVKQHYNELSVLSRREALKHLGGDKGRSKLGAAAPRAGVDDPDPMDASDPEAAVALSDAAAAPAAAAAGMPAPATRGRKRKQAVGQ